MIKKCGEKWCVSAYQDKRYGKDRQVCEVPTVPRGIRDAAHGCYYKGSATIAKAKGEE